MKYFSLFTGIGGFDLSLKELNIECVGWSEIDKYAIKTFNVNFPEIQDLNYGDITKINTELLPDFDLLVGGSPCQDLSISKASRQGLQGIKSNLFFDYVRILKMKQPEYFIWENVKGALSSNGGKDWQVITESFQEAGYKICYKVLNSADYGVPQQRKRVFIIGQRKDLGIFDYNFPSPEKLKVCLQDILESGFVDRKTSYCIDANYSKTSESNSRAYFEDGKRQIKFFSDGSFSKLETIEVFRLFGFSDEFHNKAKEAGVSNCQLYKQAGNSVTVSVIRAILKNLLNKVEERQGLLF